MREEMGKLDESPGGGQFNSVRPPSHLRNLSLMMRLTVTLCVGSISLGSAGAAPLETGQAAPPWTLPDVRTGAPVSLADFTGQPLLLCFYASWSGPSQYVAENELAVLPQVLAGREDWAVVSIGVPWSGDTREAQRAFFEAGEFGWAAVFDETGAVARAHGVRLLPTLVALDGAGRVTAVGQSGVTLTFAQSIDPAIRSLVPRRTDLAAAAQPLALGAAVEAEVARDGEAIFSFTASGASAEYTVTTDGRGFDTVLQAFDAEGNLLAENDDLGDGSVDSQLTVPVPSESPRFFVVHGFNGAAGRFSVIVVREE